ncbi:MAG: hypothetical protein M3680_33555, partial [Myxococcota bacterium]|nr:hypothetical protein [Myxococcota bacterium]
MHSGWPSLPLGLSPRRPGPRASRKEAMLLLESERTVAAGLAVRAIAEGWDNGRLGAPTNELPHEREVLGLLGVRQGLATDRVTEASESLRDVMQRNREIERSVAARQPLHELLEEFAISSLGRMILMLTAAPQMWGEIAQLYAIVNNNATRAVVDEHLLRALMGPGVNPHELAYELDPRQPLRRFGLLHTMSTEPRPFTALAPDPIVLARLRGEPLDEDPSGELEIVKPGKPIGELRIAPEIAARIQDTIARPPTRPLRIVVRGREGSGRRTLLAAL